MSGERKQVSSDIEQAIETLREGIRCGVYVAGQRLVEVDLISALGVSRSSVREALRRLAAENLVQIELNRGAMVRNISRKEVDDILEVLTIVSIVNVRKAMENMVDPKNRKLIDASLKVAQRFSQRTDRTVEALQYMEENARFWDSIAAIVDNPVLEDTRKRLQTLMFRLQVQGLIINDNRVQWLTLHEEILASILAGDSQGAEELVMNSVKSVKEAVLSLPDTAFG